MYASVSSVHRPGYLMLSRAARRASWDTIIGYSQFNPEMPKRSSYSPSRPIRKRRYIPAPVVSGALASMYPASFRPRSTISRFSQFSNPNQIYRMSRKTTWQCGYSPTNGFTNLTGSTVYGSGLGLKFLLASVDALGNINSPGVLNNIPQYTEFTSLFDMYRIAAVHIEVIYTNNVANTTGTTGGVAQAVALPTIQCCPDYDDNAAPTSDTDLLQRPETKIVTLGSNGPARFYLKPKPVSVVQTAVGTTPAVVSRKQWMDCSTVNVDHFGYKFWVTGWPATPLQAGYFQFFFTYDLEFKGVR